MTDQTQPTAQDLRNAVILAKQAYGRGEIGIDALHAAMDAYIAAVVEFKRRRKAKRLPIPTRASLWRIA